MSRRMVVVAVLAAASAVGASSVPASSGALLTLRMSPYGKIISDAHHRVLYLFARDGNKPVSTCYGVCATAWPPLLTKGAPAAGPGLSAKLLGTTKRKDGSLQVTYNGHPLYYYSADMGSKIMCQHANMHGGFWFVVNPNGTANTAKSKAKM